VLQMLDLSAWKSHELCSRQSRDKIERSVVLSADSISVLAMGAQQLSSSLKADAWRKRWETETLICPCNRLRTDKALSR